MPPAPPEPARPGPRPAPVALHRRRGVGAVGERGRVGPGGARGRAVHVRAHAPGRGGRGAPAAGRVGRPPLGLAPAHARRDDDRRGPDAAPRRVALRGDPARDRADRRPPRVAWRADRRGRRRDRGRRARRPGAPGAERAGAGRLRAVRPRRAQPRDGRRGAAGGRRLRAVLRAARPAAPDVAGRDVGRRRVLARGARRADGLPADGLARRPVLRGRHHPPRRPLPDALGHARALADGVHRRPPPHGPPVPGPTRSPRSSRRSPSATPRRR